MRVSAASSNLLEVGFQEHLLRSETGWIRSDETAVDTKMENDQAFINIKIQN